VSLLCGVDEAGRGPLAGAVFAAAVVLDPQRPIEGLADSKLLDADERALLAERIRGFGPTITGVRRTPGPHPLADEMVPLSQAAEAARRADVVVLAAPAGADTDRLVDAAFLAGMKSGSVLVNVGRGTLVDETALLQALDRGTPEFAILDVFDKEPLPADSPFWAHPRIALTGHASSYGEGLQRRNDALFVENLRRYLAGEPLLNLVDPRDVPRGPAS